MVTSNTAENNGVQEAAGNDDGILDAVIENTETQEAAGTDLVVAENLMPVKGLKAVPPKWMNEEEIAKIDADVDAFLEKIKSNPNDMSIQTMLYKLGEDGSKQMMPQSKLFETKMAKVMKIQEEGDPIKGGILGIKQALDTINPSVLAKTEIPERVAVFFKKMRLPKADEIQTWIYERRETVKSTVDGLKIGLLKSADGLLEDIVDIEQMYKGMLEAQRLDERDIYWGHRLHSVLLPCSQTLEGNERNMVEDNLAALTQVINALQSEEAGRMVFFASAQNYAKLNQQQLFRIKRRIPQLENSVLAILGLKAGMAALQDSMAIDDALTDAIGETLKDAAKASRQMGVKMTESRGKGMINLEKLQSAINEIDTMYKEQAEANKNVIEEGMKTSQSLSSMVGSIRERVEGGHESMAGK